MIKNRDRKVIFLVGPTAVGKTDLSIALAKALDTEIISCDSVQIYKSLNIGSAKPTVEEMAGVKHHLLDFVDPKVPYSVSEYREDALNIIDRLLEAGKVPIVTGGTGLYMNALIYDMDFGSSDSDEAYRAELEKLAEAEGGDHLYERLKAIDPEAAERIHPNNVRRVIRALEVNHITGQNMGDFSKDPVLTDRFIPVLIGLKRQRMKLYGRINKRVDIMLEQGLIDEVKKLKSTGLDDSFQSMQGIGYKEVLGYLEGRYDEALMVSVLKQGTRRYAKRQMTWFRRYAQMHWLDLDELSTEKALDEIFKLIEL